MFTKLHFACGISLLCATVALLILPGCTPGPTEEYVPIPYPVDEDDSASATGGTSDRTDPPPSDVDSDGAAERPTPSDEIRSDPGPSNTPSGGGDAVGEIQSGTLTAGTFDDQLNLEAFRDFVTETLQSDIDGELPAVALGQRIIIAVRDQSGRPISDARVVINPNVAIQQQQAPVTLLDQTTGSDGRVLFLTGLDDDSGATEYKLTVHPPDGSASVIEVRNLNNLEWQVTLAAESRLPQRLDLAFVIDATGSMDDELTYLQTEVRSIAAGVAELFPEVEQRYALIVYRDDGDLYVVRTFDFTDSLDNFEDSLLAQRADGGGDWPEALHLALEKSLELDWKTTHTARVLFLIADAPPHVENAQRAFDALLALRARSVALYPVAASGVDTELEYFMRTAAFLTLSQYTFLTDDSGVGDTHAAPHIPCYHVERLGHVMIRMIQNELAGTRTEPRAENILRTVGNPQNGVCGGQDAGGQLQ